MVWKSVKNNIFLYSLSLSNTINYIFYFPFIILYLFEKNNISKLNNIQIYLFFIIYDLTKNLSSNLIRKLSKCIGINKIISINLLILALISFLLFFVFIRFSKDNERLNEIIIFRLLIALINITSLFTSKIILNIFEKKEMLKKLKVLDFYEKLNNLLVFIFVFFLIPSLSEFYFYFLCSFLYNLYFFILFIIFFKCYDEKNFALYEEKINEKIKVNENPSEDMNKKLPKIKFNKRVKSKELTFGEENNYSKSGDKGRSGKRKSTAKIMINKENINLEKLGNGLYSKKINENNENGDVDNNIIVLTTNNNQEEITNKDTSNNENNNIDYKKQQIYIVNNVPISSSQRVINENRNSIIENKSESTNIKKKWTFICLILIPSEFLKYLFLIMLFLKTQSLKNNFPIKIHLLFYCGYFLLGIPIDFLNGLVYTKINKVINGKKIILISCFILSLISIFFYIFLFLNPLHNIHNQKLKLLLYVTFFILNIFLKEVLVIVLRIFYTISVGMRYEKIILRKMKETSVFIACIIFFGYIVSLLFIDKGNKIYEIILYYAAYYFLPILFLVILFINTINIL